MPRGTRHVLTGKLDQGGPDPLPVLRMADGGHWLLDLPWRVDVRALQARRVTVEGIRAGFNLLDVTAIRPAPADANDQA